MGGLALIKAVPRALIRSGGKAMFALKKASPKLLIGGGLVITTGALVLAFVNGRKIDGTIEESEKKVADAEQKMEDAKNAVNLSDEEKKNLIIQCEKDIRKAKLESIIKMTTLIGAPVLAFAGGVSMIVGGTRILLVRFGQVSSALAALQESFSRYRAMNIAEHGEECDIRYRYGITGELTEKEKVTDENGKSKTIKSVTPIVDPRKAGSMYVFEFSQRTSRKCPKDPLNMISFAKSQERIWNMHMHGKGVPVTLAEVLDDLGIEWDTDDPSMDYVLIAGWRPNGDGDNVIDFGIKKAINKDTLELTNDVLMLEFNCDGNLYHSARYDKNGRLVQ